MPRPKPKDPEKAAERQRTHTRIAMRKRRGVEAGKRNHGNKEPSPVDMRALQAFAMDLFTQGKSPHEISDETGADIQRIMHLLKKATDEAFAFYSQSTPRENFVRYASFHQGLMVRLQDAHDRFMGDPDSKQYSAAITSLKAQSELYDKIWDRGERLGVIQTRKAGTETHMNRAQLLDELLRERDLMDGLITELEVTVEREVKTATTRVTQRTRQAKSKAIAAKASRASSKASRLKQAQTEGEALPAADSEPESATGDTTGEASGDRGMAEAGSARPREVLPADVVIGSRLIGNEAGSALDAEIAKETGATS